MKHNAAEDFYWKYCKKCKEKSRFKEVDLLERKKGRNNTPLPRIMWHHGSCDNCNKTLIIICHFGYDTQPHRDYRVCESCLKEVGLYVKKKGKSKEAIRK